MPLADFPALDPDPCPQENKQINCLPGSLEDPNTLLHMLFDISASVYTQNCLIGNGSKGSKFLNSITMPAKNTLRVLFNFLNNI